MSKIIVVGDLHGDWGSLNKLVNQREPSLILQCGDFGWWPQFHVAKPVIYKSKGTCWNVKGIKGEPHVLFCDGNHENHEDLLRLSLETEGPVNLYDKVYYMPRGSTYTLPDGRVVLFFGGAHSIDKNLRTPGVDWYPEEIPSWEQIEYALSHQHVDIVISHTCPNEWMPRLCEFGKEQDETRSYLSLILRKYKPSLWFHGHWHKEAYGEWKDTKWVSLDYPRHTGRWWYEL